MAGKHSHSSIILWDSNEIPTNHEGLVYTWNGYEEKDSLRSLLGYIDTHGDRLRKKYLAWIHDLGEFKIGDKRIIDHLIIDEGLSYWWMTSFVEKNPWNSPLTSEVIRFFAIEEILLKEKPQKFRFVSSNRKMGNVLKEFCADLEIVYDWEKLPKKISWGINYKRILDILPHSCQALIGLIRYLWVRWSLRKANHTNWLTGEKTLFICSYFINFDSKSASQGHFYSHFWKGLHGLMQKLGLSENWLQNYYPNEIVPNPKKAIEMVNRFNKETTGKKKFHTFLDAFLNLRIVFCILNRWVQLLRINFRLKDIKKKSVGNPFSLLWPLIKEDWSSSLHGIICIRNLIWLELFNEAFSKIPLQNIGLYLFEGLSWERAFIHAWKKHGHGKLIAVIHTTIRFWYLPYFADRRIINDTNFFPMPKADLMAVNGKAAMENYLNLGYPKETILECEALRYGYLEKFRIAPKKDKKSKEIKVLILADIFPLYTIQMLKLLEQAQSFIKSSISYTIKPHPINPVSPSDFPSLNLSLASGALEEIIDDFDFAYSTNLTSATVDAYFAGLQVVAMLNPEKLNFSPLRGYPNLNFVNTPAELADAFNQVPFKEKNISDLKEFFFLDPNLPRWRRLLFPEN